MKNLAKSILNYYSTYNETRFRFDTRINFAWSNDDKTLDIPFFPEVAQNLLNEIKDGKRINLSIHPEEHSISLDRRAFIDEVSREAKGLFSRLPETCDPANQETNNALRQFNLDLRSKVQAIQYNMQAQKIAELQNLHGTSYQPKTSFNPSINRIKLRGGAYIDLYEKPGTPIWHRPLMLQEWYRARLKARVEPLIEKWQDIIGVQITEWSVKQMKTKWGTCNILAKRIWINLELAKKPEDCLEYIIVHELLHLLEKHHNDNFKALMDKYLPDWRVRKDILNRFPLSHEEWEY